MMRLSLVVGGFLCMVAQAAAQVADRDESAVIHRQSGKYALALCKKDATVLDQVLADDYSQCSVELPDGNKKTTIACFTGSPYTFNSFKTAKVRVRISGDTAIETGDIHASGTGGGSRFSWDGVKYSRVWLRRGGVWRVAHEHRG